MPDDAIRRRRATFAKAKCLLCGVALMSAVTHCPMHAVEFGLHASEPLQLPPVMERLRRPVDLQRHTHVEVDGSAKRVHAEYAAESTAELVSFIDTVTIRGTVPEL